MKSFRWLSALGIGLLVSIGGAAQLAESVADSAWLARDATQVIQHLGASNAKKSPLLTIEAPTTVEKGESVPVTITSNLPDTERLCLIAKDNPFPLVACVRFSARAVPSLTVRIRVAKSTTLLALATSRGQYYSAARPVQVGVGGCGPTGDSAQRSVAPVAFSTRLKARQISPDTIDAHVKIAHPMPKPASVKDYRSTHFVAHLTAFEGKAQILTVTFGPSVSDNPYLAFRYRRAKGAQTLSVTWVDQAGYRQTTIASP